MDPKFACSVLNISYPPRVDEVKRAYRQRAFETHPDRNKGKDVSEFLLVQAAYEDCVEYLRRFGGGLADDMKERFDEPENDLNLRIVDVEHALDSFMKSQFIEYLQQCIEQTVSKVFEAIDTFRSKYDIEKNLRLSCEQIWKQHVASVSQFLRSKLNKIASDHEQWIEDYFAVTAEKNYQEVMSHWYNRYALWSVCLLACPLTALAGIFTDHSTAGLITGSVLLFVGLFGTIRADVVRSHKRRPQVVPLEFADLTNIKFEIAINHEFKGISSEEAGGLGLMGGAGIGFAFGGPIGAVIGGVAGALFGSGFGKSLSEYKQEAFKAVIQVFEKEDTILMECIDSSMENFRNEFIERIKKNYHDNIKQQIKLLKGGM